jgi:hypothetical protein
MNVPDRKWKASTPLPPVNVYFVDFPPLVDKHMQLRLLLNCQYSVLQSGMDSGWHLGHQKPALMNEMQGLAHSQRL